MNSFINKRLSNLKTVRIIALAIILSITPFFNLSEAHATQIATRTITGTAATNYGTSNTFRFGASESIATATGATNANAFTVSYIANIDGLTPPDAYNTSLTYAATANF